MSGDDCGYCDETILPDDEFREMPHLPESGPAEMRRYHLNCMIRIIVGGANHQEGNCSCCGGTEDPDPPHMTRREAADAAAEVFCRNMDQKIGFA